MQLDKVFLIASDKVRKNFVPVENEFGNVTHLEFLQKRLLKENASAFMFYGNIRNASLSRFRANRQHFARHYQYHTVFPMDYCDSCGYTGRLGEKCPLCGSVHIKRLRRVSGYLSEESTFAQGKNSRCSNVPHM